MQFLIALGVAAAAATAPQIHRTDPVLVRAVFDGDTIDVSTYGRVRLLGIDAPEVSHGLDSDAPFGLEARERLASLVLHRWVRLEMEGARLDVYNRRLAYVLREDGLFVNAELVRQGLARISARAPLTRLPDLKRAEAQAQSARRGMWGAAPTIPASSLRTVAPERPRRYTSRSASGARTHRKKKKP